MSEDGCKTLTVEGTITRADVALHEDERQEFVYTDYVIAVTRGFRWAVAPVNRATPGATLPAPFLVSTPTSRPTPSGVRVRLRAPYHGRVIVEGGSISAVWIDVHRVSRVKTAHVRPAADRGGPVVYVRFLTTVHARATTPTATGT